MVKRVINKNIYVVIFGGLGNQLFQAAFGYVISHLSGADLNFIVDDYKGTSLSPYRLASFPNIRARVVPMEDVDGSVTIHEQEARHLPPDQVIAQIVDLLTKVDTVYLSGFWQNEGYFRPYKDILGNAFVPLIPDDVRARADAMRLKGAIGVHLRRHGYGHMGLVKSGYYLQAVEAIRNEIGDAPILVCSDDPGFSYYTFRNTQNVEFSKGGASDTTLEDFEMLRACRHHVIANSTFSWWPAWLSESDGGIIYAPQPWIIPDPFTNPVPDRWRRIDGALLEG